MIRLALFHKLCYGFAMSDSRNVLVEKARKIIDASSLSKGDKELLGGRMPYVAEPMIEMFVSLCEENPFGIDLVVKNMKLKLDAQGNLSKIHQIVNQENREVEDDLAIDEE